MYWKITTIVFFILLSLSSMGQVQIVDVANYRPKVDSALILIKRTDPKKWNIIMNECKKIDFSLSEYSSTVPPRTIVISTSDLQLKSVNNLAAVIVHESLHLWFWNRGIRLGQNEEEFRCYLWEWNFIIKIKRVEHYLIENCRKKMEWYWKQSNF